MFLETSGGSRISQTGGGANPKGEGKNLLFGQISPEDCMKMKEIVPGGGAGAPLDPLLKAPSLHIFIQYKEKIR